MKKFFLLAYGFLLTNFCFSHPGIGIVCDSRGNIYYTDLKQVWKLSPDGTLSIAVPGVHTHELSIDNTGNVYGEHLWYNGERLNTWGHYVWRLTPGGTVEKIKPPTPGFLDDYGFLRDSAGNVYWIERFTESRFQKKSPDGRVITLARGKFNNIRWSYCTKTGVIYFVDVHKLYRLTPDGEFTLMASILDDGKWGFGFSRKHNVFGIWTDDANNIYVAIHSQKKVKRITPDGKVEVVAYSTEGWSPTGGVFDNQGNLWLLEGKGNECRAIKIAPENLSAKGNIVRTNYTNYLMAGGAVLILMFVYWLLKKARKMIKTKLIYLT